MAVNDSNLIRYGFTKMDVVFDESVKIIEERKEGINLPLKTKWGKLNETIGGIEKGTMYIIGGRPGVGKSAFSNKLLFDLFSFNSGKPILCLYFNFEMTGAMQVLREISNLSRISVSNLLSSVSPLPETAVLNIKLLRHIMSDFNIYFKDIPVSVPQRDRLIKAAVEDNPDYHVIVVTDHTRLVKANNEANELERLNLLAASSMMNLKELNVTEMFLSQLNRAIETPDRAATMYVPQLSDLFSADSMGQTAHTVIMLQRPSMYNLTTYVDGMSAKDLLAVHVVKNRNGAVGWIPFDIDLAINKIVERV